MSVKGDIFKCIGDYLMANLTSVVPTGQEPTGFQQYFIPLGLPNLQWVDKQMGQMNHPEMFHLVPLPAILISFRRTDWNSVSRRVQRGAGIVTVWVYYENYADSFTGSFNQALAIQFFDFNEAVHVALQGFEGELFTPLDRVSDQDDEDHDMIIGTMFEYSTVISDSSGDKHKQYTAVTNKGAIGKVVKTITHPEQVSGDDPNDNGFVM